MARNRTGKPKPPEADPPISYETATPEERGQIFDAPGITDEPVSETPFKLFELVIPLADQAPGYQPMTVDLRLRGEEAIVVRRLFDGLKAAGAKLANGQPIKKYEDGLRILIRMLGSAIASPDLVGVEHEAAEDEVVERIAGRLIISSLNSSSTIAEAIALYQDNAGYREDNSASQAVQLVTACRWLLINWPKVIRTSAHTELELSPEMLADQIDRAEQFLVISGQVGNGVKSFSFRGFRR